MLSSLYIHLPLHRKGPIFASLAIYLYPTVRAVFCPSVEKKKIPSQLVIYPRTGHSSRLTVTGKCPRTSPPLYSTTLQVCAVCTIHMAQPLNDHGAKRWDPIAAKVTPCWNV